MSSVMISLDLQNTYCCDTFGKHTSLLRLQGGMMNREKWIRVKKKKADVMVSQ